MEPGRVARLEAVGHMRGLRRKNTWDSKKKNVESAERKGLAMKIIRRAAEFIGYTVFASDYVQEEWRCPNGKCGMHIEKGWTCCPVCGQKVKFKERPAGEKDGILKLNAEVKKRIVEEKAQKE